jgi:hypothetical protein
MIHHYDHRWATFEDGMGDDRAREVSDLEKTDPTFEVDPRYWVLETEASDRLASRSWSHGWQMAWRDITGIEKIRTMIISAIPRSAVGNNLALLFPGVKLGAQYSVGLLACLSSLTLDFAARQKVGGTHLNFFASW